VTGEISNTFVAGLAQSVAMNELDSYADRSRRHAPKTLEEARLAAQRLVAEGYSDHGVAAALGLAVEQVRRLLGCVSCE
jgi:hypothetical protein